MDAAYARTDDRFAIFAEPPGIRDLAQPDAWERSLARSHRRRTAAAARIIALPKTMTARISAALLAAGLVGQTGPLIGAASAATHRGAVGRKPEIKSSNAIRSSGLRKSCVASTASRQILRRRSPSAATDGRIAIIVAACHARATFAIDGCKPSADRASRLAISERGSLGFSTPRTALPG